MKTQYGLPRARTKPKNRNMLSLAKQEDDLSGMMDTLNSMIDIVSKQHKDRLDELGLNEEFARKVAALTDEEIENIRLSTIKDMLDECELNDSEVIHYFQKNRQGVKAIECWKELLTDLRNSKQSLDNAMTDKSAALSEITDIYKKQTEYLHSHEYKMEMKAKLTELQVLINGTNDDELKRSYQKKMYILNRTLDLSFIMDRLRQYGKKEATSLVEIFFDKRKSQYTVDRYIDKMAIIGLPKTFHIRLYNIEEVFLPERYHHFNNFFLYVCMRYIAYADVGADEGIMYVRCLLGTLQDMVSGACSEEEVNNVIKLIKELYEHLYSAYDHDSLDERFKANNILWKGHPERAEIDRHLKMNEWKSDLLSRYTVDQLADMHPEGLHIESLTYDQLEEFTTLVHEKENVSKEEPAGEALAENTGSDGGGDDGITGDEPVDADT